MPENNNSLFPEIVFRKYKHYNGTRKYVCKARYATLQVMDLQVKYHYYTMCTFQDMDLNQELNKSVTDIRTDKGNTICRVHIRDGT